MQLHGTVPSPGFPGSSPTSTASHGFARRGVKWEKMLSQWRQASWTAPGLDFLLPRPLPLLRGVPHSARHAMPLTLLGFCSSPRGIRLHPLPYRLTQPLLNTHALSTYGMWGHAVGDIRWLTKQSPDPSGIWVFQGLLLRLLLCSVNSKVSVPGLS